MAIKVQTVRIATWEDLLKHVSTGWIFRGQREVKWELQSSLERVFDRNRIRGKGRLELESALLRDFKRGLHQYVGAVPEHSYDLEWLAVMQHHGAPTRLLDFTYSIYVASYFALEATNAESVVWALNGPWLLQTAREILLSAGVKEAEILRKKRLDYNDEGGLIGKLLDDQSVNAVVPLNPFRLNDRLRIQKGIFLIPSNLKASFAENIKNHSDYSKPENVKKLVLTRSFRHLAIERLYNMSITRTTLFPGLDGYAQSLGVFHNSYRDIAWAAAK